MYPDDLRSLVDGALGELRFSKAAATAGIEEAMRYSLLAGGKRVRPVLALATARALGAEPVLLSVGSAFVSSVTSPAAARSTAARRPAMPLPMIRKSV